MRSMKVFAGMAASVAVLGLGPVAAQAAERVAAGRVAAARVAAARPAGAAASSSVVVEDVKIQLAGDAAVSAYVVRPAANRTGHSDAGILFLHWFAPGTSGADRSEFLSEAIALAQHGTVSLLPEQTFPWTANPVGDARDVATVNAELAVDRDLIGWLVHDDQVDPERIGVVGHDYGAMYGAVLSDTDSRVTAAVAMTPDATWGNWFVKYWLGYTGQKAAHYEALFAKINPVRHVSRLGSHLLLQFADHDIYVSAATRRAFAAAAPQAALIVYPNIDHSLMLQSAKDQRDSWLTQQLGLGPSA